MKDIIQTVKNFLLPSYCLYCRAFIEVNRFLCANCIAMIQPVAPYRLVDTACSLPVYAVSSYKEPLKSLIRAKRWSDYRASKALAYTLWELSVLRTLTFDYLVPLPLHWTRYAYRGYNQVEVITHQLSKLSGKPMLCCLKRIKRTALQSSVEAKERKQNVAHAFMRVSNADYKDKVLVLVDDLMTTGATLQAAAQELMKGEPRQLYGLVACRVE
jgi:ComF family protein